MANPILKLGQLFQNKFIKKTKKEIKRPRILILSTIALNKLAIAVKMLTMMMLMTNSLSAKATVPATRPPIIMFLVLKTAICLTKTSTILAVTVIIAKDQTERTTILLKFVAKTAVKTTIAVKLMIPIKVKVAVTVKITVLPVKFMSPLVIHQALSIVLRSK